MSNHIAISCPPPREISDADLVDELALHLVIGRQDVSDPEVCFEFLFNLDVCDWRRLDVLFNRAIDGAGKLYIAMEGKSAA